jgi:hypothetical protein
LGVPAGWAAELQARLAALSEVVAPTDSSLQSAGYSKVALGAQGTAGVLQCGAGVEVGFDSSGAIIHLVNKHASSKNAGAAAPGASWANSSRYME